MATPNAEKAVLPLAVSLSARLSISCFTHLRSSASLSSSAPSVFLRPGDVIVAVLAAASRDPLCNPCPDEFLIARTDRYLPGFGHGAHQCPGESLACVIAASALSALLTSGKLQAIMPREWRYRPSVNARIPVFLD
jgi:cytochrome P450